MAGILGNSSSSTMVSGDTSADNTAEGYVTNEQITFSVTPTGAAYVWGLAKPSGSTARASLSADDTATVTLTPDVAGYYVVTCTVDSTTTYVLRISVTQVAQTTSLEAIRFSPKLPAAVPTPALGGALFWNTTANQLFVKDAAGNSYPFNYDAVQSFGGEGTSTDATEFTLASWTPPADGVFVVCVIVASSDENNDAATFIRTASFKRVAGTVTIVGTSASPYDKSDAGSSGSAVTLDASAGAVRVRATGTADDAQWRAMGQAAYLLTV